MRVTGTHNYLPPYGNLNREKHIVFFSFAGQTFSATDYMSETPSWAVFGSSERGFDPEQTRFHRNRNKNNKVTTASAAAQNDGGLLT